MLEARVVDGRRPRRQRVEGEHPPRVLVEDRDAVGPGDEHIAVRQEVEVEVENRDPVARDIGVVEIGAPDLLPRGRVGLGDKRAGRDRTADLRKIAPSETLRDGPSGLLRAREAIAI